MKYVTAYKLGDLNIQVKLLLSRSAVQRMLREGPQAEAIKEELYKHILAELAKIETPYQEIDFDPNDFTETLAQGYSGVECPEINELLEQFSKQGNLNITTDLSQGPLSEEELKELGKKDEPSD
jgi:hypothetical protein